MSEGDSIQTQTLLQTDDCLHCKSAFLSKRGKKFCSASCRNSYHGLPSETWVPEERSCDLCGSTFTAHHRRTKYCSSRCSNLRKAGRPLTIREQKECERCGDKFLPASKGARYCSTDCRNGLLEPEEMPESLKAGVRYTYAIPRGQYVYGWYDDGELFYVGRGYDRRATNIHETKGVLEPKRPAECQLRRQDIRASGRKFQVKIIRSNLTEEGSKLLEAVLIDLLNPACNMMRGRKRGEIPPLTIDGII